MARTNEDFIDCSMKIEDAPIGFYSYKVVYLALGQDEIQLADVAFPQKFVTDEHMHDSLETLCQTRGWAAVGLFSDGVISIAGPISEAQEGLIHICEEYGAHPL